MAMIGADLSAMAGLSSKLVATGEAFSARSVDIVSKVEIASEAFRLRIATLKSDADLLGEEIQAEMTRLGQRAGAVEWSGDHRARHDEVLNSLQTEISKTYAGIVSFSTEAKSIVDGQLTSTLTDLRSRVTEYGKNARTVAGDFQSAVSRQREAFDSVMNG
jgi:hypothetical protein